MDCKTMFLFYSFDNRYYNPGFMYSFHCSDAAIPTFPSCWMAHNHIWLSSTHHECVLEHLSTNTTTGREWKYKIWNIFLCTSVFFQSLISSHFCMFNNAQFAQSSPKRNILCTRIMLSFIESISGIIFHPPVDWKHYKMPMGQGFLECLKSEKS